ncbi:MAG: MBL fold metallo-hydrolase [Archangium sp.]|nr:MBL fold metallo-hydrolase [Archangium sp.]
MGLRLVVAALCVAACAPPRIEPPVVSIEPLGTGATVDVCALVQERFDRPLFFGVDEWTSETWTSTTASVLVRHPAGLVIIDPAVGRDIADDIARAGPAFSILAGSADTKTPLVEVMAKAGLSPHDIRFALATHAHWDHVGALRDLPGTTVLLARDELDWVRSMRGAVNSGVMPRHFDGVRTRLRFFAYAAQPVLGFDRSFDVFGDGSIIAVPLAGHTPGSTGFLVRTPTVTFFFIGDITWTMRGVERPAHKNRLLRIDHDQELLSRSLGLLHVIHQQRPDVAIVPAHDAVRMDLLPRCAK